MTFGDVEAADSNGNAGYFPLMQDIGGATGGTDEDSRASSSSSVVPATSNSLAFGLYSPPVRSSVHKISYDDLRLLAYMPHRDDYERVSSG